MTQYCLELESTKAPETLAYIDRQPTRPTSLYLFLNK
jgi:hypothetical protein